ncbi:MAG: porin family protein, partial [Chlorobiaceae bacterium]|nr:porin family protein [Chlorobiaceae bacterium]
MKKTLSLLAVLAVAGVASTPVSAEASTRYVSALAGVTWYNDAEASLILTSPDVPFLTSPMIALPMDSGFTGVAALGCDYGDFRVEAELGYQRNSFENSLAGTVIYDEGEDFAGISSFDSHVDIYSMMANGFYDI